MEHIRVAGFARQALDELAFQAVYRLGSEYEAFNTLDSMFHLIPEQDAHGGSFVWVCSYGGGNFYTPYDTAHYTHINYK